METTIEVKISYDDNEIKQALSFYYLRVYGLQKFAIICIAMFCIAVVLSFIYENYAPVLILFLITGSLIYYFFYDSPIRGYIRFYRKRKGGVYQFNSEKVLIIGEEIKTECLWAVYKKGFEIPSAFLMLDDNKFIYIFPKSCFSDIEQIEKLRHMLVDKIPDFKIFK